MKISPAVLLISVMYLSCRGDLREQEPQNNELKTAQLVKPDATIRGSWYSEQGRDRDCYRYDLPEQKMVRGTLSGVKGVDAEIRLYMPEETESFKVINDNLSSLGESFGPILVHPPYLIACLQPVKQVNQPEYRNLEYEFTLTFFQPPHYVEQEPNDSIRQANTLQHGLVLGYYSTSLSGRDERGVELIERDFFVLEFPEEKPYLFKVELTGVSGIDPVLRLYNPSGDEIRVVDERGQNQGEILPSYGFQGKDKLFLSITAKDRKTNMQEYYELKVTYSEYENRYEFEPNDTFDNASTLSAEKTEGELADAGDVDIYKLTNELAYTMQYTLVVRSESRVNLQLETFSAARQRKNIYNDAPAGAPEGIANLQLGAQEMVYLKISSVESGSAYPAAYTIEMKSAGALDFTEVEPNDTIRQANQIAAGSTMLGYINPNADIDVYQITGDVAQTYKILLDGIPGCRLLLRLADKTGVIYEKREGRSDGEGISLTTEIEPKSYLLVSCSRAQQNLYSMPYRINLEQKTR